MRNKWYGNNRDLVKWSVLMHLAKINSANRILQIAYFRGDDFERVEIDGEEMDIPVEVKAHFRDIRKIHGLSSPMKISIFDAVIANRKRYVDEAKKFISSFKDDRCVVFLDPDTGLEPAKPSLNHVLNKEAKDFWDTLKLSDVLAFYQHQTNRNGEPWEEAKRVQFEKAIGVPKGAVKIGHGKRLAGDVVVFYAQKVDPYAAGNQRERTTVSG
jgi:hypothetical protein